MKSSARHVASMVVAAVFASAAVARAGSPESGSTADAPAAAASAQTQAPVAERANDQHLRVRLVGIGAAVDGDTAQFQQRSRIPDGISGGIDELHLETGLGENTDLLLDGRAIFDNHDYLLHLRIFNEDRGTLDIGYKQFRSWYDGRGGYFPPGDVSFVVFDPKLGIDRREAWANGSLLLPSGFKLTVGYRYLSRDGSKSSSIWGDAAMPGVAPPDNRRSIVPAFYQIDEQRHQADVALSVKTNRTDVGAGVRYEHMDLNNDRNVTRTPGEPTERRFTQTDDSNSDLVTARMFAVGRFFDNNMILSTAYAYNDIDVSLGGSRIYGATFRGRFDPLSPNRQQRDEGFLDLTGMSEMREHVANFSIGMNFHDDVQVLSAFRVRGENRHAHASFLESNVGAPPAFTTEIEELRTRSDTDELSYAEDLEIRYKRIKNVVLYGRVAYEQNEGNIFEEEIEPATPVVEVIRKTNVDRRLQKYATGAKLYPARWVNFSAEYAYKLSDWNYGHPLDSTSNDPVGPPPSGDRYPAFLRSQSFSTHDLSLRTSVRLPADISAVLRYDWLQSTIDTRADELDGIQSGQTRAHVLGTTISWNPASWWWTRVGANYIHSTTGTSADNYDTPAASFLRSFNNDYVTTNVTTGVALDDQTELELGYNWLSADNYRRGLWLQTASYGSRFTEHSVAARVMRKIGERTKIGAGYSYLSNDEGFAGGNYDYHAHLILTTLEFEY